MKLVCKHFHFSGPGKYKKKMSLNAIFSPYTHTQAHAHPGPHTHRPMYTHTSCSPKCIECSSVWDYNYFVVCCHPDPLLCPPDTTTPLLARYLLIKIWLPGNGLQRPMHTQAHVHAHTGCGHISRGMEST